MEDSGPVCILSSLLIISLTLTAHYPPYCTQLVQGLVVASLCLQCNVYHTGHRLFWLESHTGRSRDNIFDHLSIRDQAFFAQPSHRFSVSYLS